MDYVSNNITFKVFVGRGYYRPTHQELVRHFMDKYLDKILKRTYDKSYGPMVQKLRTELMNTCISLPKVLVNLIVNDYIYSDRHL